MYTLECVANILDRLLVLACIDLFLSVDGISVKSYISTPLIMCVLSLQILHGADCDVVWLQRDFGIYIVNMFDTGQASRVLGLPRYSLAFLLNYCCGVKADKQYQLADWRIR